MTEDRKTAALLLAHALVDRISEVVPHAVNVSADDTQIAMKIGNTVESTDVEPIVCQAGDLRENLEAAALLVLSDVQDVVAEGSRSPWPPSSNTGAGLLAYPHAEWSDKGLRLFFGAPEDPALELRPIMLDDLTVK
jgi:hypothetical protein